MGVRRYVDKDNGFFGIGGRSDVITEEEYTMDGGRHLQGGCLLYTSPSPRDQRGSRMPSSA